MFKTIRCGHLEVLLDCHTDEARMMSWYCTYGKYVSTSFNHYLMRRLAMSNPCMQPISTQQFVQVHRHATDRQPSKLSSQTSSHILWRPSNSPQKCSYSSSTYPSTRSCRRRSDEGHRRQLKTTAYIEPSRTSSFLPLLRL